MTPEEEIADLKKKNEILKAEKAVLKNQNEQLSLDHGTLLEKFKNLEGENKEYLENKRKAIEEEIHGFVKDYKTKDMDLDTLSIVRDAMKSQKKALEKDDHGVPPPPDVPNGGSGGTPEKKKSTSLMGKMSGI
jgi:chromosome segregation ATPase